MIDVGTEQRIAIVAQTDERFIVQQIDLERNVVHCWRHVTGTGYGQKSTTIKLDGRVSFPRKDVTVKTIDLTNDHVLKLFHQYRLFKQPDLMSGDFEVVKTKTSIRIRKSQMGAHHATLRCPCHSTNMRICKARSGGSFWGCPTRGETLCRITFSTTEFDSNGDLRMYDPDKVLTSSAA